MYMKLCLLLTLITSYFCLHIQEMFACYMFFGIGYMFSHSAFRNMCIFTKRSVCLKRNTIVYSAACHICKTVYFLLHTEITSLSQEFRSQTVYCVKINTIDWEQALIWIQFQLRDPAVGCVLGGLNVITQHYNTKFPQAKSSPTHLVAPCEPRG